MNELGKPTAFIVLVCFGYFGRDWWEGDEVSITGNVLPPIVLMEHDVTLSCQVRGCSSNLEVWLYKWGQSRNDALYIYSGPVQAKVQESSTGERHENGTHRGQFKNGVLEVPLFWVQPADSGQYVCAMICGRVHKEFTMDVTVTGIINASVGESAILPCYLKETHELSHWKLEWRKIGPGTNQAIYSYLYQHQYRDTCPVLYSEESLYSKCSHLKCPIIREWLWKKYKEKGNVSIRNWKGSLKLNSIKKDDAGKYQCSVRSNSFNKTIIFKLSAEERKKVSGIHDHNLEMFTFYLGYLYVLAFFMLLMFCFAVHEEQTNGEEDLQKHEIQVEEEKGDNEEGKLRSKVEERNNEAEECQKLRKQIEFLEAHFYQVDVILDSSTAHPRLEVTQDGKCVRDTGRVLQVPNSNERFDSHMFVLAKEGFVKGKHYWEVEVGPKTSWDLGVASESISRKGRITVSPQNGYWVIGRDGKKDYWARTDPWTHLEAGGKPSRIGMFLNMPESILSFYDVNKKSKLHTSIISSSGMKLFPFFSVGSVKAELDSHPLEIPPCFKAGCPNPDPEARCNPQHASMCPPVSPLSETIGEPCNSLQ